MKTPKWFLRGIGAVLKQFLNVARWRPRGVLRILLGLGKRTLRNKGRVCGLHSTTLPVSAKTCTPAAESVRNESCPWDAAAKLRLLRPVLQRALAEAALFARHRRGVLQRESLLENLSRTLTPVMPLAELMPLCWSLQFSRKILAVPAGIRPGSPCPKKRQLKRSKLKA